MKRAAQILLIAICIITALFVAGYMLTRAGVANGDFLKDHDYIFGILWAILGSTWATLSIINILKQENQHRLRSILNSRDSYISDYKKFINRVDDIKHVLSTVIADKSTTVFGQKGVGKSELLKYVADVIQRKKCFRALPKDIKKKVRKNLPKTVFYVDLMDSIGWSEMLSQLSTVMVGQKAESITDLANILRSKKQKPLVLIIDNLNNDASVHSVVNNILIYQGLRSDDKIILGSVSCIEDPRLGAWPIEIKPFEEGHCRLFFNSRGINLSKHELGTLVAKSSGLPIFLNLISLYRKRISTQKGTFKEYYISEIIGNIDENEKEILFFLCICNISLTAIRKIDLHNSEFPDVEGSLRQLRKWSSIIESNYQGNIEIKVHDLIRDIVLEHRKSEIPGKSVDAYRFLRRQNELASTVTLTMSAKYSKSDIKNAKKVVQRQVDEQNYSFLICCWENGVRWGSSSSLIHDDNDFRLLLAHGYIASLLGIGEYHKADSFINSTVLYKHRSVRPDKIENLLDFDLLYAIADMDHLLNRYELSRAVIVDLLSAAKRFKWKSKEAKALWMHAHLTGHMGDDLLGAIEVYKDCQQISNKINDEVMAIRACQGIFSIKFTCGDSVDLSEINECLEKAASLNGGGLIFSALYRSLSRYYRLNEQHDKAVDAVEKSATIANRYGLRTSINCDFARGENARSIGDFLSSITFYERVMKATEANGDVNLYTSALLAWCISRLLSDEVRNGDDHSLIEDRIYHVETVSEKHMMSVSRVRTDIVRYLYDCDRGKESDVRKAEIENTLDGLGLFRDKTILREDREGFRRLEIHVH